MVKSATRQTEALRAQLRKAYSETTVGHVLNPRNMGSLEDADSSGRTRTSDGDVMEIWLKVEDKVIAGVSFTTSGCAATIASGSMVTELSKGKTIYEALRITPSAVVDALGGLPEGNIHCAELAVNTLKKAIRDYLILQREPWKKAYRID